MIKLFDEYPLKVTMKIIQINLIFIVCCLTSCAHLKEFPIEGNFEGVATALNRNGTVSLFITHGAGGFSPKDPDTFIRALAVNLQLHRCDPLPTRTVIGENSEFPKTYGYLKRWDFYRHDGKSVRVFVLDWSPLTKSYKRRLQSIDSKNRNGRLFAINAIKNSVINDDIPDALLYLSHLKSDIEHAVVQSLCWINEAAKQSKNENIVVGYSLGGLLVINALDTMLRTEVLYKEGKKYLDDISSVFFLSNAYPLLELTANQSEVQDDIRFSDVWDWRQSSLGRFVFAKRQTLPQFQVVAIHDPNDIISFCATDYFVPAVGGCLNAFLNENVRNVKTALFGMVDPFDAHRGYGSNQQVLYMLIFGKPLIH